MIRRRTALRRRILSKYDTIGKFADDIGVSRQTVSNIIAGRYNPSSKTLDLMRKRLGISDDEVSVLF